MLTALGKLWLAGVPVDWAGFHARAQRVRVPLPTYPFERQRCWIEPRGRADSASEKQIDSRRPDIADWFYAPSWKRSVVSTPKPTRELARCVWLVFEDECGLGSQLVARLDQTEQAVIVVRAGPEFARHGKREYTLNPAQGDHYDALLADLYARQKQPQAIVHLWNVGPDDRVGSERERLDRTQALGFYSLLSLLQALGKQTVTDALRIAVISNEMQEVTGEERVCPGKATVLGPVQISAHEYPRINCRSIDVMLPPAGAATRDLVELLLAEVTAESFDQIVAYRGKHRWVQTFEPVRLENPEAPTPQLKAGGVYLITGGLGGVGLALARHLAETLQAKLVLTGRSAMPGLDEWDLWLTTHALHDPVSRKIDQVRDLTARGAEALVIRADVADRAEMQSAVAQAQERFGRIDGVIHAAGVPGGGMLQLKTRERAEQVLAAKVNGTLVLADVLKDLPLDFFVLCSSINSVVGRLGQVDYVAANAFLDAFVHSNGSQPTYCINWETWREVGMAAETARAISGPAAVSGAQPRNGNHPLLDECVLVTEDDSTHLTHFTVDKHWVLHEHGVLGKAMLPGTTYLEMARAAFAAHAGDGAVEIRNAHFLTPLSVADDEERQVRTVLQKRGDAFAFSVLSRIGDTWQEHAQGTIAALSLAAPTSATLSELEARCGEQTIVDPLGQTRLGRFDLQHRTIRRGPARAVDSLVIAEVEAPTRSMEFGPRWHSLKWVKLGAQAGLALLETPAAFQADSQLYKLHPALLDFATSFLRLFKSQGSYLPLSYKRLRMWRPLPARLYSYVRFADGNRPHGLTLRFDVMLLDEQGGLLVEIEEFAVMRIDDVGKLDVLARAPAVSPALSGNGHGPSAVEARAQWLQADLQDGLSSAEGVAVFHRILSSGLRRVVVSTRDLRARIAHGRARSAALLSESAPSTAASRPKHPRPQLVNAYAAPRNETEQKLVEIWQEVLGLESVGIHDNFFELGGDSLLITRIHTQFVERFNRNVSVANLLQYPTLADLAQFLAAHVEAAPPSLEAVHDRTRKQKAAMKQRQQKQMKKKVSS